ncbi:hypothetical protein K491DRAFT_674163 [Lophiostoma macrostomum CBS 122681]|uniref:Uncharacterized protein n=1 Tax=Lophiostoma macrostomum CBS 122681 TaxID=1314788 RepID=A0A6A6TPS4_9PLEO|nr:hypothetical protein K491DRAFT_674163 [Lophiostoma macrostomum CBS 122681]
MEAVAALGLAANILQLVDFGTRLVGTVHEIVKTGTSLEIADIDRTASDLKRLSRKLDESTVAVNLDNSDEAHLQALATEGHDIADTLLERLARLKHDPRCSRFKAIRHGLAIVCGKAEIDALTTRMQHVRNDLQFRVIVSIRRRLDEDPVRNDASMASYVKATQSSIQGIFDDNDARSRELETRLDDLFGVQDTNTGLAMVMHQETLSAIQAIPTISHLGLFPASAPPVGEQKPLVLHDNSQKKMRERTLLERLRFRKMVDRYEEIAVAHQATFRWIFEENDSSDSKPRTNFCSWLRTGRGLYWLSGKAASGKSTLMKFIDRHQTLREMLSVWAADKQFLVSSHYFWHNGTRMQRTLLGMLQALLCQVLEQRHDLILAVFPELEHADTYFLSRLLPPVMPEVKAAITSLVKKAGGRGLKLCFLIDGLDEFEGGDAELAELAEYLTSLGQSPHVKIIASSRPLAVFEDAFADCPKMRLQDLTFDDITAYVNQNVNRNGRMKQLRVQTPQDADKLVSDIVTKATGVFLWVKLVVRSLLEGLRNFDNIDDLQERLKELPSDLEHLYRFMLQKISPRYRSQASQLIQIVKQDALVHDSPIATLSLFFANEKNPEFAITAAIAPLSKDEKFQGCREMDRKLRSRTAGLLEVQHKLCNLQDASGAVAGSSQSGYLIESHVQFLHKSVTDFLDTLDTTDQLLYQNDDSFDPNVSLLRAYLMQLKILESHAIDKQDYWRISRSAITWARKAELSEGHDQTRLIDQINVAMTEHMKTNANPKQVHWCELSPEYLYAPGSHGDNFLSFCMQSGLFHYVKAALTRHGPSLLEKSGRPLLDYVLCPGLRHEVPVLLCNAELAELLVDYGARANDTFENKSLYQRFVQHLMTTEIQSLDQFERAIRIFHTLFKGGLDVKATFEAKMELYDHEKQERRYSVLRIIRMLFIERQNSPSKEGLMAQAWLTKLLLDEQAIVAAKRLESYAVGKGAKDREWRDNELVFPLSSNRLRVNLVRFKDKWKRRTT